MERNTLSEFYEGYFKYVSHCYDDFIINFLLVSLTGVCRELSLDK